MNPVPTDPAADSPTSTSADESQLELYDINKAVAKRYHEHLLSLTADPAHPLAHYLASRGVSADDCVSWNLGYAPDEWRFVTKPLLEKGAFVPAVTAGVCVEKEAKKYDFFRNRLLIPLVTEQRYVAGFTGRALEGQEPKYLNTKATPIFNKGSFLFGIDKAIRAMMRSKTATLTEGNFDVISLHRYGISNTVGKGGTALTDEQVTLLKRYVTSVTLIYDIDPGGAGQLALQKDCEKLLAAGIRVLVFQLPAPEDGSKIDADSWARSFMSQEQPPRFDLGKYVQKQAEDGLLWLATQLTADRELEEQIAGEKRMVELLAQVSDEDWQKKYAKKLASLFDCEAKGLLKQVEQLQKAAKRAQQETDEETDEDDRVRFNTVQYRHNGSIWIYVNNKNWVCVADDFQIFVKYFTEDENEEKTWILEVRLRGKTEPLYIEISHEEFCSASKLKNKLAGYRLAFKITDAHLGELWQHLFRMQFPKAVKVNRLGYHHDSGVFFFANKAVNGELLDPDEFGIVSAKNQAGELLYLSMPQQGKKKKNFFTLSEGTMSFNTWFKHMSQVHKADLVIVPVCFYLMALYRDVVIKNTNTCPMLYLKGGPSSGKSSIVRSLCLLFGFKDPAVNLKSRVLEAALIRKMSQLSNALIWLEEMNNEFEHPGVLQASYDNTGYSRSTDATSIDTDSVDIYSAVAITSNYLVRDEILFTRCVFIPIVEQQKSDEQVVAYQKLTKELEINGLGCITVEMLQHRAIVEASFPTAYDKLYKLLKYEVRHETGMVERLISNMAQVLTVAYILQVQGLIQIMEYEDETDILEEFVAIGKKVIIRQHQIASEKSYLSEFFEIIQSQYEAGYLYEGIHFRFEGTQIFLRFPSLYLMYSQRYWQSFHRDPVDRSTLKTDLAAFEGIEPEKFWKNIRFRPDETDDDLGFRQSVKDSCAMDYKKLEESFGLDLFSRKMFEK